MRAIVHMPHSLLLRGDRRVVRSILVAAHIDPKSDLGQRLGELVCDQVEAWRDFFALRRGLMRRTTLLVMAARSLATDADAAETLAPYTRGQGAALLKALLELVITLKAPECRRQATPAKPRRRVVPPADVPPPPRAQVVVELVPSRAGRRAAVASRWPSELPLAA